MPELPNMDFEIATYILSGAIVLLLIAIIRVEVKMRQLLRGRDGKSLESSIRAIKTGVDELDEFRRDIEKYLTGVERRLRRSIQGIETVRFNPFKGAGTGGNQSFSTAFLDEEGNGVVLSTLYARDRMSIYSKPVEKYSSKHELTEEENAAISETKERLKRK